MKVSANFETTLYNHIKNIMSGGGKKKNRNQDTDSRVF